MVTRKDQEAGKRNETARQAASSTSHGPNVKSLDSMSTLKFSRATKQAAWRLISPP